MLDKILYCMNVFKSSSFVEQQQCQTSMPFERVVDVAWCMLSLPVKNSNQPKNTSTKAWVKRSRIGSHCSKRAQDDVHVRFLHQCSSRKGWSERWSQPCGMKGVTWWPRSWKCHSQMSDRQSRIQSRCQQQSWWWQRCQEQHKSEGACQVNSLKREATSQVNYHERETYNKIKHERPK